MAVKVSSQADVYAVAALAGLTGLGLVIAGLTRSSSGSGGAPPGVMAVCGVKPGEQLADPTVPGVVAGAHAPLTRGTAFTLANPTAAYAGPGRNAYTYASLRQMIGNTVVTVYASGIGNVHLPQSSALTLFPLVPANEPQPCGQPAGAVLTMFPWSATSVTPCGSPLQPPMCGAPPQAGPADLYVEIYEDAASSGHLVDSSTGDASPSCSCIADTPGQPCRMRCPVARTVYPGAILFQ